MGGGAAPDSGAPDDHCVLPARSGRGLTTVSVHAAVGPRRLGGRPEALGAAPVFAAVLIVAAANRLLPVLRGGGLAGVLGYDDAVYYAGAVGLVHGRLPYQDFLFLHPPRRAAGLGAGRRPRDGGSVRRRGGRSSRLVWMPMGCLTSLIVAGSCCRWAGSQPLAGGCLYAVFPGAVLVERTTLPEGLTNLCLAVSAGPGDPRARLGTTRRGRHPRSSVADSGRGRRPAGLLDHRQDLGRRTAGGDLRVRRFGARSAARARRGAGRRDGDHRRLPAVLPGRPERRCGGWSSSTSSVETRTPLCWSGPRRSRPWAGSPAAGSALVVVLLGLVGFLACSVVAWRCRPYRVLVPVLASLVALLLLAPIFYPHYLGVLAVPGALLVGVATGVLTDLPRRRGWRLAVADRRLSRAGSRRAGPLPDPVRGLDPAGAGRTGAVGDRGVSPRTTRTTCSRSASSVATSTAAASWWWTWAATPTTSRADSGSLAAATRPGSSWSWTTWAVVSTRSRPGSPGRGLSTATAIEIDSWPVRLLVEEYELREPPR